MSETVATAWRPELVGEPGTVSPTSTDQPTPADLRRWLPAHTARLTNRLAPLWAKAKPGLAIVRPLGWGALLVCVVAAGLALRFGWLELLVLAVFLGVLLLAAIVFVVGRSTYAVDVRLARLRLRIGEMAFGGLQVTNSGERALWPATFVLTVGQGEASFALPRLSPGQLVDQSFRIPTNRRQVIKVGPVRASRGDPLGLLRRDVSWAAVQELFVHPDTVVLGSAATGFIRDLEGVPTDTLSSSDIAFHALREYVMGDDLRHIHWKTTARVGKYMVRQFEETRRSHLVVCLSTDPADYASADDFELAVSVAASLAQQTLADERDLTVLVPVRRLNVLTIGRLLDDCSRLELDERSGSIEQTAIEGAKVAPDASAAVFIAGSALSPARLHRAAARFSLDVSSIAVIVDQTANLSRRMIGTTAVINLGLLSDLPRALRSIGA
ncbi:MAG: DUF58 domain-containing protein [Propionibacteriaceae bacterium]|jgi:uncharacterized protein (DUF58 family)|nr:DUF58 domain-containing protein [Propionibacteriaceae bacterium]